VAVTAAPRDTAATAVLDLVVGPVLDPVLGVTPASASALRRATTGRAAADQRPAPEVGRLAMTTRARARAPDRRPLLAAIAPGCGRAAPGEIRSHAATATTRAVRVAQLGGIATLPRAVTARATQRAVAVSIALPGSRARRRERKRKRSAASVSTIRSPAAAAQAPVAPAGPARTTTASVVGRPAAVPRDTNVPPPVAPWAVGPRDTNAPRVVGLTARAVVPRAGGRPVAAPADMNGPWVAPPAVDLRVVPQDTSGPRVVVRSVTVRAVGLRVVRRVAAPRDTSGPRVAARPVTARVVGPRVVVRPVTARAVDLRVVGPRVTEPAPVVRPADALRPGSAVDVQARRRRGPVEPGPAVARRALAIARARGATQGMPRRGDRRETVPATTSRGDPAPAHRSAAARNDRRRLRCYE
jgi:hypothetical protein